MEKVTYLLGAGFSAPLGLPLMGNFLEKSKDMYFADPGQNSHFLRVFDTIKEMSVTKNYYSTDLFNIEEILSILEMQEHLGSDSPERAFLRYICDVIRHYTPPIERVKLPPNNWDKHLFGSSPWRLFGYFVANLFGLRCFRIKNVDGIFIEDLPSRTEYSVVTLNYDLVLETVCEFMNSSYGVKRRISFSREPIADALRLPVLAKLHGSIDTGEIVPPTWNKGLRNPEVMSSWRIAYKLLTDANHIRIIGYSLPISDSYIKYLLRSAVIRSPHLKRIDVICLDPDGSVKSRYDDFIRFGGYRFRSATTEEYLTALLSHNMGHLSFENQKVNMDQLESAHAEFFSWSRSV